jgi:hypothetical protein
LEKEPIVVDILVGKYTNEIRKRKTV